MADLQNFFGHGMSTATHGNTPKGYEWPVSHR